MTTTTADGGRVVRLWPLLVVGIAWLYFFAGAYYGIYVWQVRISSLVISGVVLILWGIAAIRSPRWRPASAIAPALGVSVAALAVSALLSRNPRISLDFVAYAVLLAGLYLLLRALLLDAAIRRRMGGAIVLLTAVLIAAYLATVMGHWISWWGLVGRVTVPPLRPLFEGLTYGNPGMVGAMAFLSWLVAVGHLGFATWRARVLVLVLGAGALAVVLVSGTRGAWLAVAATGLAAVVLLVFSPGGRRTASGALRGTAGRVALAVVAVGAVGVAFVAGPLVLDRVINSGEGGRTSYWAAAIRMFQDAIPTGVGPGMWAPERINHTVPPELDFYIPHAHNLYLQIASELGLVGIATAVFVFVVVGRLVWRAWRGEDPVRRRWAVIAILATVYFGVHQLVDLLVNMPAVVFVFCLPFAMLDATASGSMWPVSLSRSPALRRVVLPAGLVVVLAAVGWGLWSERESGVFDASQDAASAGDWGSSLVSAEAAMRADGSMTPYQFGFGLAAARAGRTAEAEAAFAASAGRDGLPGAWLDLAWLRANRGDAPAAREALTESLRLGREQAAITIAAGYVYETLGDEADAVRWYTETIRMLPRLARDPFWAEAPRAARWPEIRDGALATMSPESQADLWLSAGDPDRAAAAASRIEDESARHVTELAIAAWGGDAGAVEQLAAIASASPKDGRTVAWLARLAAKDGDLDRANRYLQWGYTAFPDGGPQALEVQVTDDFGKDSYPAGSTWAPYGIYTYRRPTTSNHLLPGLPHLEWTQTPSAN